MTIDQLKEKLFTAEQKVEKCEKTIERHRIQLNKRISKAKELGCPIPQDETQFRNYWSFYDQSGFTHEQYWAICDIHSKMQDIKGASEKYDNAKRIAAGWSEKLDIEINKEKVINESIPQIIKDFLENWKKDAFGWYVERYDKFLEFRKDLRAQEHKARLEAYNTLPEYADIRERYKLLDFGEPGYSTLLNLYPRKPVEEFLKERDLDYKTIQERIHNFGDNIIFKMLEYRDKDKRLTFLDEVLEKEKKAKLLSLVDSITGITGPITDARHLYVSGGELNGVIVGEKGVAKIQTYSAGGHSVQCFHWRTRLDDVTRKYRENPAPFHHNERICTYQFPRFAGGEDMVAQDYGLEVIGSTKDDTLVKGQYRDILAFADQYLGYQLVPEYLKDAPDNKLGLDEVISKCVAQTKDLPLIKDKNTEKEI